jgi:hypothetical protein
LPSSLTTSEILSPSRNWACASLRPHSFSFRFPRGKHGHAQLETS